MEPKKLSQVSDHLRKILLLSRVTAIARLSQFESAKKDALLLLPEIFLVASGFSFVNRLLYKLLTTTVEQLSLKFKSRHLV